MSESRHLDVRKNQSFLRIICIVLIVAGHCSATIDFSNLKLSEYQFFRYQQRLPNGELRKVRPPPPSIDSHFQHAKAVGAFVQRLVLGYTGEDGKTIPMVFAPSVDHLRARYQQRYGYRGKYLLEALGNGSFRYSSGYMPCFSCKV